ncbi:MAG TPA: tripartite tricarboxylate transporter substrate-binding protein, partial [Burkholderiales bacterium]|nr:tripartite tricarboxylate transporter substrate-binding protein [Burkholderiales bacterium]
AQAQESYPSKVIRIVTSAPGSNNDWGARLLGDEISPGLGHRVIVENRGGLAAEVVAKSPPDGYTILFYGPAAWTMQLFRPIGFDPQRDLAPVIMAISSPIVLVVHPSVPVKSVKELIALARARPGALNYASGTIGATPFVAGELFNYLAKVRIVRVPYNGTGPSVIGLVSGEVELMFPGAGSVWHFIEQKRLRALGVASEKPSPLTPGLQPIGLTVPGYEATSYMAFFMPARTAPAIINRINREFTQALAKPDVKEKLLKGGTEAVGGTPEDLGAYVRKDIARIEKLVKSAGIVAR